MEKYQFGWEPTEEALKWMEKNLMTSREKLLTCVRERREYAQRFGLSDQRHSAAYYRLLVQVYQGRNQGADENREEHQEASRIQVRVDGIVTEKQKARMETLTGGIPC
ncbi:MAG: hypothetical protein Q4D71_12435 [Oscillospiraceae bacterium]|nr:hypothetical protein [Oscillospiraceae bacterium]